MNISEYKDSEWNGVYETIVKFDNFEIVLLNFKVKPIVRKLGRQNLLAISFEGEIIWIAEVPKVDFSLGKYHDVNFDGVSLTAWYGSNYIEIDPMSGKIIKERFVK